MAQPLATGEPAGPSDAGGSSTFSSFQWIVAWLVLLILLALLNRTKFGHVLIYYSLVVMLIFLLVTNYKWFAGVMAPFRTLTPALNPAGAAGGPASSPPASASSTTPSSTLVV